MKKRVLTIQLPLFVTLKRRQKNKKWILNMNNYANVHYMVLSEAKIAFAELVAEALEVADWDKKPFTKASLLFQYTHPRNSRVDKSNPCVIIEKFACDALTDLGVWADDDSSRLPLTTYQYMGCNKEKAGCTLIITEL